MPKGTPPPKRLMALALMLCSAAALPLPPSAANGTQPTESSPPDTSHHRELRVAGCNNECNYAFDGDCDDGGGGAEFSICTWNTDCYDCGDHQDQGRCLPTDERKELAKLINCPVMAALFWNCDLIPELQYAFPNRKGLVTRKQTFDAMVRAGISEETATKATNKNWHHFDEPPNCQVPISGTVPAHCTAEIDIFGMNTVQNGNMNGVNPSKSSSLGGEHFRSTGIRDVAFNEDKYRQFELGPSRFNMRHVGSDNYPTKWTLAMSMQAVNQFNCESNCGDPAVTHKISTNDMNKASVFKDLMNNNLQYCGSGDSATIPYCPDDPVGGTETVNWNALEDQNCFSDLHSSVKSMHKEFGHPPGREEAELSRAEMRALWEHGDYPSEFKRRRDERRFISTALRSGWGLGR